MLEGVAQPIEVEAHQLNVGVSIGIALYPSGGVTSEDLLRNADAALYDAKKGGGDSVRVYTGPNEALPGSSA
jgi:diguanylate cyclase (GGDEF)-like protein